RKGLKIGSIDLAGRRLAGGDVVAQVGLSAGSNLKDLGAGDAILVVASDLHEEAPVWWLRVKQAAERGATLVTMNARATRLDKFASHAIRYAPGQALTAVHELLISAQVETENQNGSETAVAGDALVKANNLVIFYGGEGLALAQTDALARSLANLLLLKNGDGHAGKVNNGLVPVWPGGNEQGAWDMGVHPALAPGYKAVEPGMDADAVFTAVADGTLKALYLVGVDLVGWGRLADRGGLDFLVVQELFLTETAALADVVLPAQSWAEREGSFTSGERRVQRTYPAINPVGQSRADWQILAQIGEKLGAGKPAIAASLVFKEIARAVPQYKGMDYRALAQVEAQWPVVGGDDFYFGGNAFRNTAGLGQTWAAAAEKDEVARFDVPDVAADAADGLRLITATALYTPGRLINHTDILADRLAQPEVWLNESDAAVLDIQDGAEVAVSVNGRTHHVTAQINGKAPAGLAVLSGVGVWAGTAVAHITKLALEEEPA
ncbi:MAG: molybdopterin oxidoreductase family protein, partial [Anaerolineae bacterium]